MSFHGLTAHFFVVLNDNPMVWMDPCLFSHSPPRAHLGCFHFLVIMNGAALNLPVQVLSCFFNPPRWHRVDICVRVPIHVRLTNIKKKKSPCLLFLDGW